MRMRRKPNLAARMSSCGDVLVANPCCHRGRWLDGSGYNDLFVELGCGKGRFTVETAMAERDVLFIALEKNADAMVIAMERAVRENLQNIRFMKAYADDIPDYFAPGEVSRIYINFCDPWPGNRHAKRRLTCGRFLALYRQVLRPGGEIRFKTDNLSLFEFSLREFEVNGLEITEVTRDLHRDGPTGVMTDYEQKFHSMGLPVYQCILRV